MSGAIYVSDSGNRKIIGSKKADATYVSIKASCPKDCAMMGKACYAELGHVGITTHRLDDQAKGMSPLDVAHTEAMAIKESYNGGFVPEGRDLRLHVAGDSRSIKGTRLINKAVGKWKARGGGDCWSYTHAWKHVPRSEWSNVSILASVDNLKEVDAARMMGYAPALVVSEHPSEKAYKLQNSDVKWIPCPNQTKPGGKEIGCTDCRLCFNSNRLFESNMGIAFAAHGIRRNQIKKRYLTVVQ